MGIVRPEQENFKPMLNLPSGFEVQEGDRLVLMARHSADVDIGEEFSTSEEIVTRKPLPVSGKSRTNRVLILGWNHQIPALIKEFGTYEDENYHLSLVSLRSMEDRRREMETKEQTDSRVQLEHVVADIVKESDLRKVDPASFDNILLVSSDRLAEEEEADARTMVAYVLLEEILENAAKRPQILLELADPSNESLIRRFQSEVIISPMILSHLLAAIALRRELHSIYNELFTVGGAEIIFRNLGEYGLQPGPIRFSDLERRAAEYHETALGVFQEQLDEYQRLKLKLNANRHEKLELKENMKLVVLTTVY